MLLPFATPLSRLRTVALDEPFIPLWASWPISCPLPILVSARIVVRTAVDPMLEMSAIGRQVGRLDPSLPSRNVKTMEATLGLRPDWRVRWR